MYYTFRFHFGGFVMLQRLYIEVLMLLTGVLAGMTAYEFTSQTRSSYLLGLAVYCFLMTLLQLFSKHNEAA